MTPHGASWMRHTEAYLKDHDLIKVFRLAMKRAGFPEVSAAAALEAICADFLSGAQSLRTKDQPWKGSTDTVRFPIDERRTD